MRIGFSSGLTENNMLGFARKLMYRAASALERRSDEKYYFIGRETKIDHTHSSSDFLLTIFGRKSIDVVRKFYRLIDVAADMDNPDFDTFRVLTAVSGAGLFGGISDEGCEYLIKKAYRRGMSFRAARAEKAEIKLRIMYRATTMRILRNSMYGFFGVLPNNHAVSSLSNGSMFIDGNRKIKVKIGSGLDGVVEV